MKITLYLRNFLTHHYLPLCLELEKRLGDDFKMVSQKPIYDWRLKLGFEDLDKKYDFVIRSYESEEELEKAKQLAQDSDIIIVGELINDYLEKRAADKNKLTLRYSYRILLLRDGFFKTIFNLKKWKEFYRMHIKHRKGNTHLLAINGYAPKGFNRLGLYKDRVYKWGYFIDPNERSLEELLEIKRENDPVKIIWVARFISWKHPEMVLRLAKNLKKQNYNFKIQMLGTGDLEDKMRRRVKEQRLEDVIEIVGGVPADKVQGYMEKSNIFLGTSDAKEGWGVTINEAMNNALAIVANRKIGSVPFLIEDGKSGMTYKNYREFEDKVKRLIEDEELREKIAVGAYEYITEQWTPAKAAENIIALSEALLDGKESPVKTGPASKARPA